MDWFDGVPKVELHLHLEGAIPYDALWALVQKYGGHSDVSSLADLKEKFVFRDFPHFIDTWLWKSQFLREYEDFTFIAEAFARSLEEQNIRYAEVHYVPGEHTIKGHSIARYPKALNESRITEALREGLDKVPGVKVALILDICRDIDPEDSVDTLNQARDLKELGLIGIGLGGSEQSFAPALFSRLFMQAREWGFNTTAHAGEAAGPESIWSALNDLGVKRIGHGTKAIHDLELIEFLWKNNIVLEMCPLSNLRTNVVSDIRVHPIRRFFDYDLFVTVNTDDPFMFNSTLAEEFRTLSQFHNFNKQEIQQLILNGIDGSWLDFDDKESLKSDFKSSPAWHG